MIKKIALIVGVIILFLFAVVLYTNIAIHNFARGKTFSQIEHIKPNKVGLVLGTAKYKVTGGLNPYFKNRIEAAVKLYKSGKIDFILVSGDNAHINYNEPRDLKKALIKRGIPKEKIVLDYAGFRTLDSVIRAKKVFGQDSITIISQKFHNERAVYLAEKNGLQAVAFNAKDPKASYKVTLREYFAKTKAYFDVLFNVQPKFLGKPVDIQ